MPSEPLAFVLEPREVVLRARTEPGEHAHVDENSPQFHLSEHAHERHLDIAKQRLETLGRQPRFEAFPNRQRHRSVRRSNHGPLLDVEVLEVWARVRPPVAAPTLNRLEREPNLSLRRIGEGAPAFGV